MMVLFLAIGSASVSVSVASHKATGAFTVRQINEAGIALVKEFEGFRPKAYFCAAGKCTIGYGHTRTAKPGMTITREQAEELLREDLRAAEDVVWRLVTMPVTSNQHAALVSFVFSVGETNFRKSTLRKLVNAGRYREAAEQFALWDNARDSRGRLRELKGLIRRRAAEAKLFLTPDDVAVVASEPRPEDGDGSDPSPDVALAPTDEGVS